jgi:hypothetical protein
MHPKKNEKRKKKKSEKITVIFFHTYFRFNKKFSINIILHQKHETVTQILFDFTN